MPKQEENHLQLKLQEKQWLLSEFLDKAERGLYVFYGGAKGGGKGQHVNSNIVTPFGMKRMGDIKTGDLVASPDGTYSPVIAIHPLGKKKLYRITFIDGASSLFTLDHLWYAKVVGRKNKRNEEYSIYTTEELIDLLKKANDGKKRTITPNVLIPLAEPIQFTPVRNRYWKGYPVDPYVLGVLIGDGGLTGESVYFFSGDKEIVDNVNKTYHVNKHSSEYSYSIPDGGKLKKELLKLGLMGCRAENKFVPDLYKFAPLEDRYELIKGLFDTDGYIDNKGHVEFSTVSNQLALDVQYIIRSLGGKATLNNKIGSYKDGDGNRKECQKVYTLYIQIKDPSFLFSLTRKKNRKHTKFNGGNGIPCRRLISIEYEKTDEAQCITIRNPSGLYVTDDFIVTHNSYAARAMAIKTCLQYSGIQAVIIRRTFPELLANHIRKLFVEYPFVKDWYKAGEKAIYFPNGSVLELKYLSNVSDVYTYQGIEYDFIMLDEATQHEEEVFKILKTSLRSDPKVIEANPGFKPFFLMTGNPGGVGHGWIKRLFIDRDFNVNERSDDYYFISAKVHDNPIFLNANPDYLANLQELPTDLRRAYLDGDWHVFVGQFFSDWRDDIHIIEPFEIPESWLRYFSLDWGYSPHPFHVGWYAVDPYENVYKYRELTDVETPPKEVAQRILEYSRDENLEYGIGDTQMWEQNPFQTRGEAQRTEVPTDKSIALQINEILQRQGLSMMQANKSRVTGWTNLKTLMKWEADYNEDGTRNVTREPQFKIFKTCSVTIGAYPNMIHSLLKPEDMQKIDGDDPCDTDRYAIMAISGKEMPATRNYRDSEQTELDKLKTEWEKHFPGVIWGVPEPRSNLRVLH